MATPSHAAVKKMTDDDLVAAYDAHAVHTVAGLGFYRDEILRRQIARQSRIMVWLTVATVALAVANVVLVAILA